MSILIKGMKMPKRCEECACMSEVGTVYQTACGCKLTMRIREIDNDTRPDWCPLVEVPPHGRLIDADDIDCIAIEWEHGKISRIYAPTIIPADEEESPIITKASPASRGIYEKEEP